MSELKLASEFPATSRDEWLALVEKTLKGVPFDKKLVTTTYDGLKLQPLYERARQTQSIEGRAAASPWGIIQRVDHPNPVAANAEALHDLGNGATGLALLFAGAPAANGYGLAEVTIETLERVFDKVSLDAVSIRLDARPRVFKAAASFLAVAERRGIELSKLDVALGIDPFGVLAAIGSIPETINSRIEQRARFAADLSKRGFRGQTFIADGRPIHDAGGSEVQELAYVIACALAYLRALEGAGLSLDAARKQIAFLLSADANQYLTIAKFRALRKLWARIEETSKIAPAPIRLHAETAWRMTTQRDLAVNWLRTTIAAFSAGMGGADCITLLPHTAALGLPDRFARRIARNIQLILMAELNVHRVADPTAGSGAIENLTTELCRAAWKLFQEIESAGGVATALTSCLIQNKVEEVRRTREINIATRKDPITGTSDFANVHEPAVSVLNVPKPPVPRHHPVMQMKALPRIRLSEPFERLRDAADRGAAFKNKRPAVFLANLGPVSGFTARANFAKNFFAAGGIEALPNEGFRITRQIARCIQGIGRADSLPLLIG